MRRRIRLAALATTAALVAAACSPSGITAAAGGAAPSTSAAASTTSVTATSNPAATGSIPSTTTPAPDVMAEMPEHETCDAHAGDNSRQPEHCAALTLTAPHAATAIAVTSGPWSAAATWGGTLPGPGARIHIPTGTTVDVDGIVEAPASSVRIDGTLSFATGVDTALRVDTMVGSPGSVLAMGTPDAPITATATARIVITDDGPIDRSTDTLAIGRGLVLHGTTTIHGADKTPFVEAATSPTAGDTTLHLAAAPTGWAPGDRLVVAGTDIDGDETAVIAVVTGATVTLDAPLRLDHTGPAPDLNVHVANLTRNAVIESEATDITRRGHLMFMHTTDVDVANAGFHRLGRTNKLEPLTDRIADLGLAAVCVATQPQENVRGRYALHFHRAGVLDTPAASVRGTVVTENPGWAYVNHSSNVDFHGNVAYDVDGAAFSTEAGDEIGSFTSNISIRTHGSGGSPVERQNTQDFGHAGVGFWFQGGGVRVEDNVAAGATGAGFLFYTESLVEPHAGRVWFPAQNLSFDTGGLDRLPVVAVPILDFRRNEAYGSDIGARSYYHRTDIGLGLDEALEIDGHLHDLPQSRIEDLTVWGTGTGYMANYTVDTVFDGLRIVGTSGEGIGFDASNVYNRGVHRYEDFDVSGHEIGVYVSQAGDVTVSGGRFNNREHNIFISEARQVDRRVTIAGAPEFAGPGSEVAAVASLRPLVDSDDEWFLLTDRISIAYGAHAGSQLFFEEQAADTVLFASAPADLTPEDPAAPVGDEYLRLTNAELRARFGTSFGGTFSTPDARATAGYVGLVGSPAPEPGPLETASQQRDAAIADEFADFEADAEPQFGMTVEAADCEEYLEGDELEELREECEAPDLEGELAEECAELLDELDGDQDGEDEDGEDEDGEEEFSAEDLRAELAEIDPEELREFAAECAEARREGDLADDPEYAEECRIVEEFLS